MKVEINIKNGHSKIVLLPENEFEKTMLENGHDNDLDCTIIRELHNHFDNAWDYKMVIEVTEKQNK